MPLFICQSRYFENTAKSCWFPWFIFSWPFEFLTLSLVSKCIILEYWQMVTISLNLYKQRDNSGTVLAQIYTHISTCAVKKLWVMHSVSHILFIWQQWDKSSHFSITSQQYQFVEKCTERAEFKVTRSDFSSVRLEETYSCEKMTIAWGHSTDIWRIYKLGNKKIRNETTKVLSHSETPPTELRSRLAPGRTMWPGSC